MILIEPGKLVDTLTVPKLYDWQEDHAVRLMEAVMKHGAALDGSDTGTGKTVVALEVARALDLIPFVVCPKSVIPAWEEWMGKFRPGKFKNAYNYEKLRMGRTTFLEKSGRRIEWTLNPEKVLLIFDEVHRCKGHKSLNSKMLAAARRRKIPVLMLSATACANPVEMRSIGYALGMHRHSDWWSWCGRNGCAKGRFGGLQFNGNQEVLSKIHGDIYPDKGSRIRIGELPEGAFPDNLIIPEGYALDSWRAVDNVYETMEDELNALAEKRSYDSSDSPLVLQLRARQETELLKVPIFVELANDAVAEGSSVVVFVNFTQTFDSIVQRLESDEFISMIRGGQSTEERQREVDLFQSNEARICVCMIQAGGVGLSLHDGHGGYPRVSLISPSFSAVEVRQTLGRIHRAGGKSPAIQKIVFAAKTVEMRVCRAIRAKLKNLDLINDDELNPII